MTPCIVVDGAKVSEGFAAFIFRKDPSALKIEEAGFSETLVAICQTARYHIPEDSTLRGHRCKNLRSHTV
jgi:hypothetical protein